MATLALGYKGYEIMRRDNGRYYVRKGSSFVSNCHSIPDGKKLISALLGEW